MSRGDLPAPPKKGVEKGVGSLFRACAEIIFGFLGLALQDSIGLPSSVHQGFVAPFV